MKIQSLSRGLGLLEAVAANAAGITLTALCRELRLHQSTAHHLLRTLAEHGYVVQDEARRAYRPGPKMFRLASTAWPEGQLARLALPYLRELVRRTGESANLAVRKADQAVLLETVDGEGTLRVVDRVGAARPIYASGVGKVLLAWTPAEAREAIVGELRLTAHTPRTIVERRALRREIIRVRKQGYAIDDEEMAAGVRCIAAPVFAMPGRAAAAIGIAGPAVRVSRRDLLRFEKPLAAAVRRLSERLHSAGD